MRVCKVLACLFPLVDENVHYQDYLHVIKRAVVSSDGISPRFHERKGLNILGSKYFIIMETGLSPAPETAAPLLHDLSNQSGAESLMASNRSTGDIKKEGESPELQGELNTSQNLSLGMGSESREQVDCPTDESSLERSNQADNRISLVLSKVLTLEKSSIITEKDQNDDASDSKAVHSEDVATGLSEEAARGTCQHSSGKNLKKLTNGTEFELPEEVMAERNGHYVRPMSPMTPDTLRTTDEFNRTVDLEPVVSEAIAGLSPILSSRESDYCMIKRTPSKLRVGRSESSCTAKDATLEATSPSTSRYTNGLLSQFYSYHSDQDQASTDGQSTQAPMDKNVETTEVRPEVSEHDEINDPRDEIDTLPEKRVLGASLETTNSPKEAKTGRMRSSIPTGDVASSPKLEQAATHFGEEHDTGTSHPEFSLKADVFASQASHTLEEDKEKRLSSSSPDTESHSLLEQAATHIGRKQDTVTSDPDASLEVDGVEVDDERTEELESSSIPCRHLDLLNSSESTNRDSLDSVKNGCNQLEFSRNYRDLASAKKHLDASSLAFIERLRGAAHRRKLQVARSRDSLAAKEREQLLSIASAKEQQLAVAPELPSKLQPVHDRSKTSVDPYKPFKARPVPNTTGHFGSGGQVGVPKVEKKPTTTPFSPLLGARRPREEGNPFVGLKVLQSRHRIDSQSLPFKARPAPPTTGYQGHGGQVGVPKIPKRPPTVPESPLLGKKRTSLATTKNGKGVSGSGNRNTPASNFPSRRHVKNEGPFVGLLSGSEVSPMTMLWRSSLNELINHSTLL